MHSLVAANVRRSCREIESDSSSFSPTVTQLASDLDRSLPAVFREGRASVSPILFESGTGIVCEQQEFFGFYLLREAIRGCLSAANFQIAGTVLLGHNLFAPAVPAFYTSAFHALGGYLALNGRALLDKDVFHWFSATDCPETVAACLTRKNSWKFEKRGRSHPTRWKELRFIFSSKTFEVPHYFRQLARALFPNKKRGNPALMDYLRDPAKYTAEIEDFLDDFLKALPEIRHRGLYHASGEDPFAREALADGEQNVSTQHLARQTTALGEFAQSLLDEITGELRNLLESLSLGQNSMLVLYHGIGYPFRDELRLDLWDEENPLRTRIDFMETWLRQGVSQEAETCV